VSGSLNQSQNSKSLILKNGKQRNSKFHPGTNKPTYQEAYIANVGQV